MLLLYIILSPACYAPWEQGWRGWWPLASHTGSFHTYCTLGHSQRDMEGQLGKYGTIFTVARFTTPPLIRTAQYQKHFIQPGVFARKLTATLVVTYFRNLIFRHVQSGARRFLVSSVTHVLSGLIGCALAALKVVGSRMEGNSNMQEFFCTTLY